MKIDIVRSGLSYVYRTYGTGCGDGEYPLAYHNGSHTQNVLTDATKIAKLAVASGRIKPADVPLIRYASAHHDYEQRLGPGLNEDTSAEHVAQEMREAQIFPERQIIRVKNLVKATEVEIQNGIPIQHVTDDLSSAVILDADLAALGKPAAEYLHNSRALLRELSGTDDPDQETANRFWEIQIRLLESGQFLTLEANELFPFRRQNIEVSRRQIKKT